MIARGATQGERDAARDILRRLNTKHGGTPDPVVADATTPASAIETKGPTVIFWGDVRLHTPPELDDQRQWAGTQPRPGHFAWLPEYTNPRAKDCWASSSLYGVIRQHDGSPTVLPYLTFTNPRDQRVPYQEQTQGWYRMATQYIVGLKWTVLAWWDRTGDQRFGSNSQLWAHGEHSLKEMAQLLVTQFPLIAGRQIPGTPIADLCGTARAKKTPAVRVFYLGPGESSP